MSPNVQLLPSSLEFSASGTGASGVHDYNFKLSFYKSVDPTKSQYRVLDRQVEFQIQKTTSGQWPRLIEEQKKPAWLKVDFERLVGTDDDDDELDSDFVNQKNYYNDLLKDLKEKRSTHKLRMEIARRMYLFIYNAFQLIGFTYIVAGMAYKYSLEGAESMATTYSNFGSTFRFCQLIQIMEAIHPLLGYTKGGIMFPIIQISGRLFFIFGMIEGEPRMQTKPAVFYIFLAYSLAEIIRYPYYILRTLDINVSIVTWVRYTAWILLYPVGFFCEGVMMLQNIPYFEETGKFSFSLPNALNSSFYFPTLLRLYLLFAFFPLLYMMMSHMYRQRAKILRTPVSNKLKKK